MCWKILWVIVLISNSCLAQHGAKAMSLGGLDLESVGVYASLGNPAGLTSTSTLTLLSGYSTIHVPGLQTIYLSAVLPLNSFDYGLSLQRTGDDWLNEFKASFLMAHLLENTALGFRINYHQFSVKDFT